MKKMGLWVALGCLALSVFSGCTKKTDALPPAPDQFLGLKKVMSTHGYERYSQMRAELVAHPEDKNRIYRRYFDDLAKMHPNGPEPLRGPRPAAQPSMKPVAKTGVKHPTEAAHAPKPGAGTTSH